MGRSPCCSKVGLRRGPWSTNEDTLLSDYIQLHGEGHWRSLPNNAGLSRCGKSCRLRWMNYLKPGIKRGNITQDEEDLIVRLHALLGNRWSLIAGRLPGRTDNEIKNYWNTHLFKKLKNAGIQSKHFPKPKPKPKPTTAKKKKNKVATAAAPAVAGEATNNSTKVYLPKPIRLSSRTKSNDSFTTSGATSSSDGAGEKVAAESYVPVLWPPLFEMEDGGGEGFMGILPLLTNHSAGGDVDMLDQVYDEYLQLLHFDH